MWKFSLKQLLFMYMVILILFIPLGLARQKDYKRWQKLAQFNKVKKELEQNSRSVEKIRNFALLTQKLEKEFVFEEKYYFLKDMVRFYLEAIGIGLVVFCFLMVILKLSKNFSKTN